MDCAPFDIVCWGHHSQSWKAQVPQRVLSEVKVIAGTDLEISLLLKDGSLHKNLAFGETKSDVIDVFAGGKHIYTLSKDGKICDYFSEENTPNVKMPVPLHLPSKDKVIQVACGTSHMFFLTKHGQVYTKGDNRHGQCGLGKEALGANGEVRLIKSLKGLPISQVAAGGCSSFCVTISGRVFAWGKNEYGQLGLEGSKPTGISTPKLMEFSTKNAVAFVSAGENHTAILTKDGGLYMCGKNDQGQLGHVDIASNRSTPWRVDELKYSEVTQVACGRNHTIVYVPACRQVFGFGDNAEGQLGMPDDRKFISNPEMLSGPWRDQKTNVTRICAVENSTFVFCSMANEQMAEVDYRLIPEDRQIIKIDESFCQRIALYDEDIDDEKELEELGFLFRSQSCLSASFCSAERRPMTKYFLGIDTQMARELMTKLCKHENPEIRDVIVTSLQKGIVFNIGNHSTDIEALRVYVILPIVIKSVLRHCSDIELKTRCLDDVFCRFWKKR